MIRVFEQGDMERSDKSSLFFIIKFMHFFVWLFFVVFVFVFKCTVIFCVLFVFVFEDDSQCSLRLLLFLFLYCVAVYFCLDEGVVVYLWSCCSFFYYFTVFVVIGFLNSFFCVFIAKLWLLNEVMLPFFFCVFLRLLMVENCVFYFIFLLLNSYSLFFVLLYVCTLNWCNDDGFYCVRYIGWEWLFFVFDYFLFFCFDMVKTVKNGHELKLFQMQRIEMTKYEIL